MHIAIVGGSLAGALLALQLRDGGHQISIFDPRAPWEKPCGGAVYADVFRQIPILGELRCSWHCPSNLKFISSAREDGLLLGPQSAWRVVSRYDLNRAILEVALRSPAVSLKAERVNDLYPTRNGSAWLVRTAGGSEEFDVVVGADGVNSVVRKRLMGPIPREHLAITVGYMVSEVPLDEMVFQTYGDLLGYLWYFPRPDHVSVGIGTRANVVPPSELWRRLDGFLSRYYPRARKVYRWGALIPTPVRPDFWKQRCAGQNWALIGDAAGHVDPITGIGIPYALASSNLVAQAIRSGNMESYERAWRDQYGDQLLQSSTTMERFISTGDVAGFEHEMEMGLLLNHLMGKLRSGRAEPSKEGNNAGGGWKIARPDYVWSFPRDHWAHRGYNMEWWYFTGHLEVVGDPRHRFGYQFTIFRIGQSPEQPGLVPEGGPTDLLMGHAAVTDVAGREHRFVDLMNRESPMLVAFHDPPHETIARSLASGGTDGRWVLRWNGVGFDFEMKDDERAMAFRLTTRALKPLVLQGPNGYIRKGKAPAAASQYYSFTRLATRGTLTLDGHTRKVRGTSWMDKEFGSSQLSKEQIGWDWFCLQLHGGRELMLYLLRRNDGTADYRNGTLVTVDGTPRYLEAGEWSVQATDTWTSPETKAMYPMRWLVELPVEGLCLDVVPEFPDQENCSRIEQSPSYWEGAVRVIGPSGKPVGRGYVELIGYGENSRPNM